MGRPEPCVLFSQTFVHPQLDEYVDEVLFAEAVVITACEFLEQNASSASQVVPLVGATSPPSFALEVFVQCEGETRFRRLCQPFLYSHSSSNVLEVEAVVTNHVVVRGSYRSLSLVIYGNTAEDLGQFNIEFDDSSLSNLVSSTDGKLEDLPLALHSANRAIEESLTSLKALFVPVSSSDISVQVKQFLQLVLKMLEFPSLEDSVHKVVTAVVKVVCSLVTQNISCETTNQKHLKTGGPSNFEALHNVVNQATKELVEVLQRDSANESTELLAECTFLESETDLATSEQLVDMIFHYFSFRKNSTNVELHPLLQKKNIILGLSMALLLCSGRESCYHFVNGGGMELLAQLFSEDKQNSSAVMLLLLGVIEHATRHPIGCEGILGWWPREDENIPSGISKGYSQLLKLFLRKPRHDIARLATYILQRLRFYEIASRYEYATLSTLAGTSAAGRAASVTSDMLNIAKSQLKKLLKLTVSFGPIEDPSPVACATRSLILGQTDGLLSYKATSSLISSSICSFSNWGADSHLLSLLKERGFLPLSSALLSSSILRSEVGDIMDAFLDIASTIGAILLSLLMCRSGLIFLLHHPEVSTTLIDALKGTNDMDKEVSIPLRYASVLLSKGFVCSPREVGMIIEMHLRVVNAIDRLLTSPQHSEEFLWVLWELCGLSRSDCGRQALLVLGYFPEALSILIEALHSVKELDPIAKINGASPINLAIFHSAAEILEVIVTDSTASSLASWIGHAMELHKALHSSSPGSNRKDAPTRLLEWIDAGLVYHKSGAIALLRYSAVLASGGDAHLTSSSILVSDLTDIENVVGDPSGGSDINVMENLSKIISEKTFDGVVLRDSSIAQLTTAVRILAFISENSTVAAALYDEGAVTVLYAILIHCSFMLERSSSNYDYLVDEGAEYNSTSDLLLERNREQSLVDLLVPSLVLLINLLQKLEEAKEQHRNTKLMNALLRLHREVSPKLAACAADLSSPYPDSTLGFAAVCHLVVSALACWPIYGWTPGLFHSLLANVQGTSILALGPKETCSLLCLLNDLFPEEGVGLWKNGMPLLSALRMLAVGTLLGSQKEKQINWYLEPLHLEKLLNQLTSHLDEIAQVIQHYAISTLVVIQDMLRVFIIRVASQKPESVCTLLRPILSYILHDCVSDASYLSEIDAYKVFRYLDFLASILEHPCGKAILLEEGIALMLTKVLERCFNSVHSDGKQISDGNSLAKCGVSFIDWCAPVFKSITLLCASRSTSLYPARHDLSSGGNLSTKDCSLILSYILKLCQVLPVGKELLSCLTSFKEMGSCNEGRNALVTALHHFRSSIMGHELEKGQERDENHNVNDFEWRKHPPLLDCWMKLLKSVDSRDGLSNFAIEAANVLAIGSLCFCMDNKSLNLSALGAIKCLYGLPDEIDEIDGSTETLGLIQEMTVLLSSKIIAHDNSTSSDIQPVLHQASESAKSLLVLLKKPASSLTLNDIEYLKSNSLQPDDILASSKTNHMGEAVAEKVDDYLYPGGFGENFLWECPENRLSQAGKRKLSSLDGVSKRVKGENSAAEVTSQNAQRGLGQPISTRRDTFRQRKPNTSRPPSMHVDDYVLRERSGDGVSNSNVIAVQRVGTGGRPPSIHVDEFMARQRERQNSMATVVGEPSARVKSTTPVDDVDKEKVNKSKQLKTDLDDDLQGIDIVFDDEESEPDDNLPFPKSDDILQQPAPVMVEQSSPRSIVEETESDVNESGQFPHTGAPLVSNVDENTQNEFSTRMSVSRPEMSLTREPSVSSDKKFLEQSDDLRNPTKTSTAFESVPPTNIYVNRDAHAPSVQLPSESRKNQPNFYARNSSQQASGSRGFYDQRVTPNQPPLPPIPPLSTVSPVISHNHDPVPSQSSPFVNSLTEVQQPLPAPYQVQSEYMSSFARTSLSSPGGSVGPHPPLPPPPPFSSGPMYSVGTPEVSQSGTGMAYYTPPPLMPPMVFSRPATIPVPPFLNTPTAQQSENPSILPNISISSSSIQSVHQLQPLQPPLQRPPQTPQHLWPLMQSSQQSEQGSSMQNPIQLQVLHQQQISSIHASYQAQGPQQELLQPFQQQQVENSRPQVVHQQGDVTSQKQQELGMSLHEYFKDPQAISALLSNKEELCRLLEQHPKLMQMLEERLGQQ